MLQGVTKNKPMEKQADTETEVTLKKAPAPKLTEDKVT